MTIVSLLQDSVEKGASDLHLTVGRPPTLRINGVLIPVGEAILMPLDLQEFVDEIVPEKQRRVLDDRGEVDFSHAVEGMGRFRVNAFHQRGTYAFVLRTIPYDIPELSSLGLPSELLEVTAMPRGLFLVCGPTGSGKSTTLASMINIINTEQAEHIITIEDPIEYLHRHKKSIVNQREIGADAQSFSQALRAAMRQDPDVIMIGEMRDLETIGAALTAAETGHMVFATLHTNSAAQTIDRIIDVFPPNQQQQIRIQLSATLQGVLVQQLLPRIDVKGRSVATEFLLINPAARNLIREGKTHQIMSVIQTGGRFGMHTMDMSLKKLIMENKISKDIAMEKAGDKESLQRLLGM